MPCHHKFQKDLFLDHLDYEPTTLIVGSFSPEWPTTNNAKWFYGRTETNCFWDVLPKLFYQSSILHAGPADWKQFCRVHQIALTDLISTIEDADANNKEHQKILGGFSDEAIVYHFEDFVFVDIVKLLQRYPSVKYVYLTRGITESFWRHLWNPVTYYCSQHDIVEGKLLSPSYISQSYLDAYNSQHPNDKILSLPDYVLFRWQQQWLGK